LTTVAGASSRDICIRICSMEIIEGSVSEYGIRRMVFQDGVVVHLCVSTGCYFLTRFVLSC
jgi:hypothetical protein